MTETSEAATEHTGWLARLARALRDLRDDLQRAWRLQGIVGVRKEVGARTIQKVWRSGRYLVFEQDHQAIRATLPPEGVIITPATDADWGELAAILPRKRVEMYRSWVARGRVMLVAWRDREPIGYMWYTDRVEPDIEVFDLPLPPGAVYGFGMYVVPHERRRGIGGALIAERGRHAKARGFTHAWRMVRDDNVAARRIAVRASYEDRVDDPVGELYWTKVFAWERTRYVPLARSRSAVSSAEPVAAATGSAAPAATGLLGGMMVYGTTRGITEGLLGLRGVALASILGPHGLGIWAMFRLVSQYLGFASLGITGGLEREIAQRTEPGNAPLGHEAEVAARTALGFLLCVFGALGAAAGIAACFVDRGSNRTILFTLAVVLVSENVLFYALVMLRCRGRLLRYGILEIVNALMHLVLATSLAARWGVPGALTGFALASVAALSIALRGAPARPMLDRAVLGRLLRVGFPVRLNLLLGTALVTADRWVVGGMQGTAALGRYAFAVAIAGLAGMVVWVARTVIFPGVYRSVRLDGSVALQRHLNRTVLPFAALLPPILGAGALIVAPIVARFLPEYAEAIPAMRILIFTGATTAISSLGALGVIAADRQRWLPAISATALAINVLMAIGALRVGFGLSGVAVAALLGRCLLASATLLLFAAAAGVAGRRALRDALIPAAWCLCAMLVATRWRPDFDLRSTALALAAYVTLMLPLAPVLRARIGEARNTSS